LRRGLDDDLSVNITLISVRPEDGISEGGVIVISDTDRQKSVILGGWTEGLIDKREIEVIGWRAVGPYGHALIISRPGQFRHHHLIAAGGTGRQAVLDVVIEIQFGVIAINAEANIWVQIAIWQRILAGERVGAGAKNAQVIA